MTSASRAVRKKAQNRKAEKNFASLIEQANQLLNSTMISILAKYETYPFCLMEYHENGDITKAVELCLDTERATLRCYLGSGSKCISVFIYPDDGNLFPQYINYLNANYKYDYLTSSWKVRNGCIVIEKDDIRKQCFVMRSDSGNSKPHKI